MPVCIFNKGLSPVIQRFLWEIVSHTEKIKRRPHRGGRRLDLVIIDIK